jgi:DNA-directed RNA polymerase specialized sigma24 family protein
VHGWTGETERTATRLVQAVCAAGRSAAERDRSWQALLGLLAPHLEVFIARTGVLRRVGLGGDDDVRTVLVEVIARLHDRECRNLRDFLASEPVDDAELEELALLGQLATVTGVAAADPDDDTAGAGDAATPTPLRGWLITLCRFAAKDHVKRRFGWTSIARLELELADADPEPRPALTAALTSVAGVIEARWRPRGLVVLYRPGTARPEQLRRVAIERGWELVEPEGGLRNKRDLYSGADRLDDVAEAGARPPITDLLTARELAGRVQELLASFPGDMQRALALWMTDTSFEDIGAALRVPASEARALVRAGHARLRDRLRPEREALLGRRL